MRRWIMLCLMLAFMAPTYACAGGDADAARGMLSGTVGAASGRVYITGYQPVAEAQMLSLLIAHGYAPDIRWPAAYGEGLAVRDAYLLAERSYECLDAAHAALGSALSAISDGVPDGWMPAPDGVFDTFEGISVLFADGGGRQFTYRVAFGWYQTEDPLRASGPLEDATEQSQSGFVVAGWEKTGDGIHEQAQLVAMQAEDAAAACVYPDVTAGYVYTLSSADLCLWELMEILESM